jgi:hypothetical protein
VRVLPLVVVLCCVFAFSASAEPPSTDDGFTPPVASISFDNAAANDFVVKALQKKVQVEHGRYLAAHRRVKQLTRTLAHTGSVREAVDLACSVYGSCSTLWRRMNCESGGYRFAHNPSGASGLFQFLPSTWAGTPFGGFSIYSPYANALAAGWMEAHGRGSEWVCR